MAIWVPWLGDAARMTGFPVIECAGWRNRGHGGMRAVEGVVGHHTATSDKASGDYPSERIVTRGRSDLPGPLCNLGLGRSGTVYVVAAGLAYHAGASSWAGFRDLNSTFLGIEAESAGYGGWSAAQRDAYPRLVAALLHYARRGAERYGGHKDVCIPKGRKPDPAGIDTGWMQNTVRGYRNDPNLIRRGGGAATEELDMSIATEIRDIVRKYVPSGLFDTVTLPRSPERVRSATVPVPPRNGVITGNEGRIYVSLTSGENAEIREIYAESDWNPDGKRGQRHNIQGPYTLQAGDRQPKEVPAFCTQVTVVYRSDAELYLGVEVDTGWK